MNRKRTSTRKPVKRPAAIVLDSPPVRATERIRSENVQQGNGLDTRLQEASSTIDADPEEQVARALLRAEVEARGPVPSDGDQLAALRRTFHQPRVIAWDPPLSKDEDEEP